MRLQLEALMSAGKIDRITFDLSSGRPAWRVNADGCQACEFPFDGDDLADLLEATRILTNTELGIVDESLQSEMN